MKSSTCYYEVLGVSQTSTIEEIRKAYKIKALLLHPDKNRNRLEEATREFSLLQQVYAVLSDPHERRWYDNHRDAILKGKDKVEEDLFDLMPYFNANMYKGYNDSTKGFYTIYRKVFEDIETEENRLHQSSTTKNPSRTVSQSLYTTFGNSSTPFIPTLKEFYTKWTRFSTLRTFSNLDKYRPSDSENRDHRRYLEKENKKLRDQARQEYNDLVRSLALFIKKRDPRVEKHNREAELTQKLENEQKKKLQKEKKEQLRRDFVEQAWTKISEDDYLKYFELHQDEFFDEEADTIYVDQPYDEAIWECEICDKAFKSEKQLNNHKVSNKHLKLVQELKRQMFKEERKIQKINKSKMTEEINSTLDSESDTYDQEEEEYHSIKGEFSDTEEFYDYKTRDSDSSSDSSDVDDLDTNIYTAPNNNIELELSELSLDPSIEEEIQEQQQQPSQDTTLHPSKVKKKKRRAEKGPKTPQDSSEYQCQVCGNLYDSRNSLFKHIKSSKHAALK